MQRLSFCSIKELDTIAIFFLSAGTCWMKRTNNGKCKQPMARNVSKEDCCAAGHDVGFSEKEMSEFEYFFATAIGDGTSCSSCIGQYPCCYRFLWHSNECAFIFVL